ncbi:MAG TPA: SHOCT domain-containing protein [Thermomicrobiales bacterium]|nr:SHOCT domain-containing protein [Thermomicrobiales bacterium]
MFRRRQPVGHRGPGLASTVARTAVIAGTATAASGAVAGRQEQKRQAAVQQSSDRQNIAELQQQVEQLQAQEIESNITHATPGAAGDDLISQLARLGELHQQGILTAAEFEAAKARVING